MAPESDPPVTRPLHEQVKELEDQIKVLQRSLRTGTSKVTTAVREELALLTPDQVCELLSVTKGWLYKMVQRKEIPHVRLGKNLRFKPDDLRIWVMSQYVDHQEPVLGYVPEPPRRRGRPRKT